MTNTDLKLKLIEDLTSGEGSSAEIFGRFIEDILRSPEPFYVITSGGMVYASANPPFNVRLYSNKEVAENIAERLGGTPEELSSKDVLLRAKQYFLEGKDGYLLDEKDKEVTIDFPTIIGVYQNRIAKDRDIDQDYVDAVRFIAAVKKNKSSRLSFNFIPEGVLVQDNAPANYSPVSIPALSLFTGGIKVKSETMDYSIPASVLRKTYSDMGFSIPDKPKLSTSFENYEGSAEDNIVISDLSLNYDGERETVVANSIADTVEVAEAVETEVVQVDAPIEEKDEKTPKVKKQIKKPNLHFPKLNISKKANILLKTILFCVFVIVLLLIIRTSLNAHTYSRFEKYMDTGSYTLAYEVYSKNHLEGGKSDNRVNQEVDAVVEKYVYDEITKEEADASMAALKFFSPANYEEKAKLLDAIAVSKENYRQGLYEVDYSKRLEYFKNVIPQDKPDYEKVKEELLSDKNLYAEALLNSVETDPANSEKYLSMLLSIDPTNSKGQELQDNIEKQKNITIPIHISSFSLPKTGDEKLIIKWENISGREMKRAVFYLSFYDEAGNLISHFNDSEKKSVFEATFEGPIPIGYVQSDDEFGFVDVWTGYTDNIAYAKLSRLFVEFYGDSVDITLPEVLEKLI